jgi:uncharacterized protein YyaL (SSP411 family)
MLESYQQSSALYHTWKNGKARIPANLDDLSFLIQALLQLGAARGDNKLIIKAAELTETALKDFINEDGNFFYFTSEKQKDIPVRKIDVYDGVTPSGNSVMAYNLLLCGMCMENTRWIELAEKMLEQIKDNTLKYSYSYAFWGILMQRKSIGLKTVICAGNEAENFRAEILEKYLPQAYIITSKKEISELLLLKNKYFVNKNHIFVCSQEACQMPVSSVNQAVRLIEG